MHRKYRLNTRNYMSLESVTAICKGDGTTLANGAAFKTGSGFCQRTNKTNYCGPAHELLTKLSYANDATFFFDVAERSELRKFGCSVSYYQENIHEER